MSLDPLEVVALEEIPELLKIFEKEWPKYYPLNQYVKIFSEFKKEKVQVPNQTLYRHGDVENGVYLMESIFPLGSDPKNTKYRYFIFTASDDLSVLKHALMETSRIPWTSKAIMFEVTFDRFALVVDEVAKFKGLEFSMSYNNMMWNPEPLDCSFVPEDMYVTRLDKSHITEINSNWPHRFPGSEIYLSQQISNNFGLGLFRKTDKKLAASALTYQSGGIFVLFTDPQFRGKGYAEVIVRHMSHELHKRGRIPFATIIIENIPSYNLFNKVGFKHFTKVYYMINPKVIKSI